MSGTDTGSTCVKPVAEPEVTGLRCPVCGSIEHRVLDSRPSVAASIRRRRECVHCMSRFRTRERVVGPDRASQTAA